MLVVALEVQIMAYMNMSQYTFKASSVLFFMCKVSKNMQSFTFVWESDDRLKAVELVKKLLQL
jgi:hypothetical protein